MASRLPAPLPAGVRLPSVPSYLPPPADAPTFNELFGFMRDAERRFDSLRMRIEDRTSTAHGEELETHEIWLRHPERAKVVTRFGSEGLRADSLVWVTDGERIRTYDARSHTASERPVRERPEGITDPRLPAFARVYVPITHLPMESLAETFVHPYGYCRNLLMTARLTMLGTTTLAGDRDAWLIRADQPRRTELLTDRPDHWLEVGVDRVTGMVLLIVEHVGDVITRHAEATYVETDLALADDIFRLHLSKDVTLLY
ncbi:MAG TPA: hypothetical protein VFK38_05685 [Candidatus Limnocylindrales bacterium]|nr:hypothetical protein [Candidatus Limnocylindrales bacterium]